MGIEVKKLHGLHHAIGTIIEIRREQSRNFEREIETIPPDRLLSVDAFSYLFVVATLAGLVTYTSLRGSYKDAISPLAQTIIILIVWYLNGKYLVRKYRGYAVR